MIVRDSGPIKNRAREMVTNYCYISRTLLNSVNLLCRSIIETDRRKYIPLSLRGVLSP